MKKVILAIMLIQCSVFGLDIDSLTPDSKYYAQTIIAQDKSNMALVEELYEKGLLSEFGNMNLSWSKDYLSEVEKAFPLKERIKLFFLDKKLADRWRSSDLIKGGPYYIRLNGEFYENPSQINLDNVNENSTVYLFGKARFSDFDKFMKIAELAKEYNFNNSMIENIYLDSVDNFDEILDDIKSGVYLAYYNKEYNLLSTEDFSKSYSLYKKLLSDNNFTEEDITTILGMKTKVDKMEAYNTVTNSNYQDKAYQLKKLLHKGK